MRKHLICFAWTFTRTSTLTSIAAAAEPTKVINDSYMELKVDES